MMPVAAHNLLGALSLARPGMLWFALVALLPLLIHLWSRQRSKSVSWGAMRYLLAAMQRHSRRIQLRQWLLLVVRTAILLILALALADPILSRFPVTGASQPQQQPTHYLVVLDGSYSMLAREDGESRMQLARERISRWIDQAEQGDGFTLLLLADPPRVVIGQPAFDASDVRRELQGLAATHSAAGLDNTLVEIDQLLARTRQDHPQFGRTVVGIFTDLEAHTWRQAAEATTRQLVERVADQATLVLFDLQTSRQPNAAVTRLEQPLAGATTGNPIRWEAVVQNFSSEPLPQLVANWFVDEQPVQQQVFSLAPGETRSLQHQQVFATTGWHQVHFSLQGDQLDVDNHRWQVCNLRDSLRVLCVEGRLGEARHLQLALNPGGQAATPIQADRISIGGLIQQDLDNYQLVCLCNVARFSKDEAGLLAGFVQRGGSLAFMLGDQVQLDNYNLLFAEGASQVLLPGRLLSPSPPGLYRLDPLEYQHPLISVFQGQQRTGLLSTPVYRYQPVRLARSALPDTRVALALEGGDPLIIDHSCGEGRVLLVTTAISPLSRVSSAGTETSWSDLSSWPSFLPLVQEMVLFAAAGDRQSRQLAVGQRAAGNAPSGQDVRSALIRDPAGQQQRLALQQGDGLVRWSFAETLSSGVYGVSYDEGQSWPDLFAVNVDTVESQLGRFERDRLPAAIGSVLEPGDSPAEIGQQDRSLHLFQWLLAAVLGLLLLETWLGHRLGRRAA
jgi:hypothetical protein